MPSQTRSFKHQAVPGASPNRKALGLALAHACEMADIPNVRRWLLEGANPNQRSTYSGWTSLHLTCGARGLPSPSNVRHKLSFTESSCKTSTPCDRVHIAALLLDAGAALHAEDGHGRSALHVACAAGFGTLTRFLIERGSFIEAHSRASYGSTPLCQACSPKDAYVSGGPVDVLLELGADANALGHDKIPPLHRAVSNPGALASLLRSGADPNVRDGEGRTALLRAFDTNRLASARLLITAGADPTLVDQRGRGPGWDTKRQDGTARYIFAEIERFQIQKSLPILANKTGSTARL